MNRNLSVLSTTPEDVDAPTSQVYCEVVEGMVLTNGIESGNAH
jgi:hypothetical protein